MLLIRNYIFKILVMIVIIIIIILISYLLYNLICLKLYQRIWREFKILIRRLKENIIIIAVKTIIAILIIYKLKMIKVIRNSSIINKTMIAIIITI